MNKKLKPFVIVLGFWAALFFFVVAGYSGGFGLTDMTGFAVIDDNGAPTGIGIQSIIIMVLFFTNIVTMFFLVREIAKK